VPGAEIDQRRFPLLRGPPLVGRGRYRPSGPEFSLALKNGAPVDHQHFKEYIFSSTITLISLLNQHPVILAG